MCDFISGANIHPINGSWSCTANDTLVTDPCAFPIWPGLTCDVNNIVSIDVSSFSLDGKYVYSVFHVID